MPFRPEIKTKTRGQFKILDRTVLYEGLSGGNNTPTLGFRALGSSRYIT